MIYGYARVSTVKQKNEGNSLEGQTAALKEHGAVEIYTDAFTGTKADRPNLNRLLPLLKEGDTLIATKLDRLSRSASQGIALVDDLLSRGVKVHILNMGVIDNTPAGKLIRNIFFAFAEFERDMIVERTQEGKAIAKMRPDFKDGRPRIEPKDTELVITAQQAGEITLKEACETLGMSRSTYYRRINDYGWTASNRSEYRKTAG